MPTLLIHDATLIDGTGADPRPGVSVRVEDGRITRIAPNEAFEGSDETVIDASGRYLLPGLTDAHVHLGLTEGDGQITRPLSAYAVKVVRFIEETIDQGFTTVRDAGALDPSWAGVVSRGMIRGPRILPSGAFLSQTGGHGDFRPLESAGLGGCLCCQGSLSMTRVADGVAAVRQAARDELRRGATQIKIMASGGVASPSDPIWNLQYSEEEMRAIVWEAQSWRTYVMAHAYTPEAIRRCVEYGVRSIEHGNLIDAETAAYVAEQGAFVVPTLCTYDALSKHGPALGFPKVSLDKLDSVRGAGLEALELLRAAGVKMGFGTDLLGSMHEHQLSEFAIRAQVLPAVDILRQATSINAELLNRRGELGVVAPGALAGLIVVDGDPIADIGLLSGQGEAVRLVMKGGAVYKDRL